MYAKNNFEEAKMKVLYTEPEDSSEYIALRQGGETVVWMDYDAWFNPIPIYSEASIEALVPELREFILRWRKKALEEKETFVPYCPEKHAGTKFVYGDKSYEIPGMPGISNELYAHLSTDIEKELQQMGCKWTTYTGSID